MVIKGSDRRIMDSRSFQVTSNLESHQIIKSQHFLHIFFFILLDIPTVSCFSYLYSSLYLSTMFQYGHAEAGGVEHVPPGWSFWVGLVSFGLGIKPLAMELVLSVTT